MAIIIDALEADIRVAGSKTPKDAASKRSLESASSGSDQALDRFRKQIDRWRRFLAMSAPMFREEQAARGGAADAHDQQRGQLHARLNKLAEQLEGESNQQELNKALREIAKQGDALKDELACEEQRGVFAYLGYHFRADAELQDSIRAFIETFEQAIARVQAWRTEFEQYNKACKKRDPDLDLTFWNYAGFLSTSRQLLARTRRSFVREVMAGHDKMFGEHLGQNPQVASQTVRKFRARLQKTSDDLAEKKELYFACIERMRGKFNRAVQELETEAVRAHQKWWVFDPNSKALGYRSDVEVLRRKLREDYAKKLVAVSSAQNSRKALLELPQVRQLKGQISVLLPLSRLAAQGESLPAWQALKDTGQAGLETTSDSLRQLDASMEVFQQKASLFHGLHSRHSWEFKDLVEKKHANVPAFQNYRKTVLEPADTVWQETQDALRSETDKLQQLKRQPSLAEVQSVQQGIVRTLETRGKRCDAAHRRLKQRKEQMLPLLQGMLGDVSSARSQVEEKLSGFSTKIEALLGHLDEAREKCKPADDDEPQTKQQKDQLRGVLSDLDKQVRARIEEQQKQARELAEAKLGGQLQGWADGTLHSGLKREAENAQRAVLEEVDAQLKAFEDNSKGLTRYLLNMARHPEVSSTSTSLRGEVVTSWLQALGASSGDKPDSEQIQKLAQGLCKLHRSASAEVLQLDRYIANLKAQQDEAGGDASFYTFVLPRYEKTRKELVREVDELRAIAHEFVSRFDGLQKSPEKAETYTQKLLLEVENEEAGSGGGVRSGPSATGQLKTLGDKKSGISSANATVAGLRKTGLSGVAGKEGEIKQSLGLGGVATKPFKVDGQAGDANDIMGLVGGGAKLLFAGRKLNSTLKDVRSGLLDKTLSAVGLATTVGGLVDFFAGTKMTSYLSLKGAFTQDFGHFDSGLGGVAEGFDGMGFSLSIVSPISTIAGSMKAYRHGTSTEARAKAVTGLSKTMVSVGSKAGLTFGAKALGMSAAATGGVALIPGIALFALDKYFGTTAKATEFLQNWMQGTTNVLRFTRSLDDYEKTYKEYSARVEPRVATLMNRPETHTQVFLQEEIGKAKKLVTKLERFQVDLLLKGTEVEDRFTKAWREIQEKVRTDNRVGDAYDLKAAIYFDLAMKYMGFKLKREAVRQNAMVFEPLIRDYSDPANSQLRKLGTRYTALLHLEQLGADASEEEKGRMSQEREYLQMRYEAAILSKALDKNWRGQALGGALGVSKSKVRTLAKKLTTRQRDFIAISLINGVKDEELSKVGLSDKEIEDLRRNPRSWREHGGAMRGLLSGHSEEMQKAGLPRDILGLLDKDSDEWQKHLSDYATTMSMPALAPFDHKPVDAVLETARETVKKLPDEKPEAPVWKEETSRAIESVQADTQKLLAVRSDIIKVWQRRFAKAVSDRKLQSAVLDMLQKLGEDAAITHDDSGAYPLLRPAMLGLYGMFQKMQAERDPTEGDLSDAQEKALIKKMYKENHYALEKMDSGSYFSFMAGKVTFSAVYEAYDKAGFRAEGEPTGLSEPIKRFYNLIKDLKILWGGRLGDFVTTAKLREAFKTFKNLLYPVTPELAANYIEERAKPLEILGAVMPGGDRLIKKDCGAIGAYEVLDTTVDPSEQLMAGNTFYLVKNQEDGWPKNYKMLLAAKKPDTTNPDEVVERWVKEDEVEHTHISASFFGKQLDSMFLRHEEERDGLDKNSYALLMRQGLLSPTRGLNMASNLGTTEKIFHVLEVTNKSCSMQLVKPGLFYEWKIKKAGGRGLKADFKELDLEIPDADIEGESITLEETQAGHPRYLVAIEEYPTFMKTGRIRDRWLVRALDPETVRDMLGMDGWVSTKDVKKVSITKPFEDAQQKRYNEYLDKVYAEEDTLPRSPSTLMAPPPEKAEREVKKEARAKRGGFQLDILTKSMLEQMLGRRLGDAELFIGQEAGKMADSIYADAFAFGNKVFFASGQYSSISRQGLGLLAHELTHVAQHQAGEFQTRSEGSLEAEAHAVQHAVEAGPATVASPAPPPMTFAREHSVRDGSGAASRKATDPSVQPAFNMSNRQIPSDALDEVMVRYNIRTPLVRTDVIDYLSDQVLSLIDDDIGIENERREAMDGVPFFHNR